MCSMPAPAEGIGHGANSDTSVSDAHPPRINDVYNYGQNKQISGFQVQPLVSLISTLPHAAAG